MCLLCSHHQTAPRSNARHSEFLGRFVLLLPDDLTPSIMAARPSMALALGQQQVAGLARAATLEQLREKLETGVGEGPERKMARLAEEQQRLMQQAFQHNLLAMASQMPMNLRLGAPTITTRGQCSHSHLHGDSVQCLL